MLISKDFLNQTETLKLLFLLLCLTRYVKISPVTKHLEILDKIQ